MQQENISDFNESFERYRDRITNFSNEFEFGLFVYILRRSLPVIIGIILLFTLGAFLFIRYTVPIFEANTVLQLEKRDKAKQILDVSDYMEDESLSSDLELLRSKYMMNRTISRMDLTVRYFEKGRVRSSENYGTSAYHVDILSVQDSSTAFSKQYFIGRNETGKLAIQLDGEVFSATPTGVVSTPQAEFQVTLRRPDIGLEEGEFVYYFTLNTHERLAAHFSEIIKATVLSATAKTIQLSCEDPNPLLARDLVMQHALAFLEYDKERKKESAENVLYFIDSQLDTVAENLRNAEFLLNSFKQEHKLSDLSEVTMYYLDRLSEFEEDQLDLQLERSLLEEVERVTQDEGAEVDIYNLVALLVGSRYENTLTNLLNELQALLKEKEEMQFEVTEESDYSSSLTYRIDIQRKLILQSVRSLSDKLDARTQVLQQKTGRIESTFQGLPAKELEYARYQRLFNINEKYYTILLEKRIEYRISKAGFVTDNKILEPAKVSNIPIYPVRNLVYSGFLGFALLLGFVYTIVRYLLHNNITSLNEIAKLSQASIGVLGLVPKFKEDIPVSQLIIDKKPKALIAEAFRSIRTNLQFVDNTEGSKVLAITSTISSEGKTFVAINLAGIISLSGKRVIIMDLDMRRPRIHRGFDVENDRGMSTLLIGKHTLEQVTRKSSLENLDFVTAGPIPPNPSELIISERTKEIIEEAKSKYDVLVIDNPPVGLVTDGISVIQMADYPIYIFRADYSKKHFVQNVDRLINENGIKKMSVILNSVDVERNKYGYYYGYGYGYGYGYAYSGGYGKGYYGDDGGDKGVWARIKSLWK